MESCSDERISLNCSDGLLAEGGGSCTCISEYSVDGSLSTVLVFRIDFRGRVEKS